MNVPQKLTELGFGPLVSVVPPDGELSPKTHIDPNARGKAPARRNAKGQWYGYNFLKEEVSPEELERTGANIGIRAAHFPGLDIDSDSPAFVNAVVELALEELGTAPQRLSRAPRRLLMFRTMEPFNRVALVFTVNGKKHVVEFLCDGRQYLIHGVHPSGQWYRWLGEAPWMLETDDLPLITKDRAVLFLETLRAKILAKMPNADVVLEGEGAVRKAPTPPQEDLEAPSVEALEALMRAIPNDNEFFPDRDDFLRVGFAVKAAGAPWPEEARSIFHEWAAKWKGPAGETNAPDYVDRVWDSMEPPYRAGWGWLLDRASELGADEDYANTHGVRAQYEFEADEWPPHPQAGENPLARGVAPSDPNPHELLRWSEWQSEEVEPAVWCAEGMIERGTRGWIFGPGGSGKSWFAYALALQLAHGEGDVLKRNVATPHAVYLCRAEGARRDTHRCLRRIQNGAELPANDRLVIDHAGYNLTSKKGCDALIANVRKAREMCGWGDLPLVLIFDPWSRLLGGASDSDREAKLGLEGVDYVHRQLGGDVTIVIIHHVRKRQQGAGADKRPTMRGLSEYLDWCDFAIGFNKIEERRTAKRRVTVISEVWCEKLREMAFDEFAASLDIDDEKAVYTNVSPAELAELRANNIEEKQAAQLAADVKRAVAALSERVGAVMSVTELRDLMTGIANRRRDGVRDYLLREGQLEDAGRDGRSRMIRVTEKIAYNPEEDLDEFGET